MDNSMGIEIFNGDCLEVMCEKIGNQSIDVVITSPPYNNSRVVHTEKSISSLNCRYKEYNDNKTNDEYCEWICNIFNEFNRIVKTNGVVLWNVSYGSENPMVMFDSVHDICHKTNWMIADVISWKKRSALPNNVSSNKLTRICEFVFVFCRKDEYDTYKANKRITGYSPTGQAFYSVLYNFLEADNNDGSNELNKATFSTEFVIKLLEMYSPLKDESTVIFDPFMGTGTTAFACKKYGVSCFGSEISKEQCEYANKRLMSDGDRFTLSVKEDSAFAKVSLFDF